MRVLLTGGAGFVGTNLTAAWIDRAGVELRVLDNGSTGAPQAPLRDRRVDVRRGDILDAEALRRAADGVDAIVHLAAMTGVLDSLHDPLTCARVNVEGTVRVLEAARRAGVGAVAFASSNAAVGDQPPPLDEAALPNPVSPYGASKLAGEAMCAAYAAAFGVRTVALRFSNLYGPYSVHKGSVVASYFRAALDGRPLTVHGDGAQTRDFLYTTDLADAIWRALERAPAGSVYQVASGRETAILDLAQRVRALVEPTLGRVVPVQQEPARAGDVARNYSAVSKAERELGFTPSVGLDDGLRLTWEWFRASVAADAMV